MIIKKTLLIIMTLLMIMSISSCHHHKDCKGKRKRANTKMGGWL
jgi:hypothetical protein